MVPEVDEARCCAYANCVMVAPEVFELPDGADVVQVRPGPVPPALHDAVREAVRDCPMGAISLAGQEG
jgi:ferredoxin